MVAITYTQDLRNSNLQKAKSALTATLEKYGKLHYDKCIDVISVTCIHSEATAKSYFKQIILDPFFYYNKVSKTLHFNRPAVEGEEIKQALIEAVTPEAERERIDALLKPREASE